MLAPLRHETRREPQRTSPPSAPLTSAAMRILALPLSASAPRKSCQDSFGSADASATSSSHTGARYSMLESCTYTSAPSPASASFRLIRPQAASVVRLTRLPPNAAALVVHVRRERGRERQPVAVVLEHVQLHGARDRDAFEHAALELVQGVEAVHLPSLPPGVARSKFA
jgi:hypothetical protein